MGEIGPTLGSRRYSSAIVGARQSRWGRDIFRGAGGASLRQLLGETLCYAILGLSGATSLCAHLRNSGGSSKYHARRIVVLLSWRASKLSNEVAPGPERDSPHSMVFVGLLLAHLLLVHLLCLTPPQLHRIMPPNRVPRIWWAQAEAPRLGERGEEGRGARGALHHDFVPYDGAPVRRALLGWTRGGCCWCGCEIQIDLVLGVCGGGSSL